MSVEPISLINQFEELFQSKASLYPVPSLEHLSDVAGKFAFIPYENLTKIIRASKDLGTDALLRKPAEVLNDFARYGAGGTCFSLTYCLMSLLEEYGYESAPRMADLGRQTNNHCALVTTIQGIEYLTDPGYLITQPLPLPETGSIVHPTRLHPVRLETDPGKGGMNMMTLEPDGAKHRYHLRSQNCSMDSFMDFWRDSFSWNMMYSLLVTRVIENGRFYLHDRHARWFDRDGRKTAKVKEDFDLQVAEFSGIHVDIINRARTELAKSKTSLKKG